MTMRELGVCRSAPLVAPDGDGLGPEVDGDTVGLSVGRNEGSSVEGSCGIGVVGTCDGGRIGFFVGPPVGVRVVGTCDGDFVGVMVGLIVGDKVLGRCDIDGADVGISIGAGLGLGVAKLARGTEFSGHLLYRKRRFGFRDKLIVVVSTNVPKVGNASVVEGQTVGVFVFTVQSGPTSSVTGNS